MHRPRILLITDRAPGLTAGYGIRVANVAAGLSAVGDVHVCLVDSSDDGVDLVGTDEFTASVVAAEEPPRTLRLLASLWTLPNMRYRREDELRERIRSSVAAERWDMIWFSRARVHRLCGDLFDHGHKILDLDDLNDRLLTSLARDRWRRRGPIRAGAKSAINTLCAVRWDRYYRTVERDVDLLVVTHDGDRRLLGAANTVVVPNGYPGQCLPGTARPGTGTLLFVGPLSYEPNRLAVRWLIDEVLDRIRSDVPDARLSVVGDLSGVTDLPWHQAVTYQGFVPDVGPFYHDADVAVAPLQSGGGTRIKVQEAMARRRPLVATGFAIEGLDVTPDHDIAVAEEPAEFARRCVQLLTDPDRADAMVERAAETFDRRHRAERSSGAVSELAERLLGAPQSGLGGRW